jgi:hypothetical protein
MNILNVAKKTKTNKHIELGGVSSWRYIAWA